MIRSLKEMEKWEDRNLMGYEMGKEQRSGAQYFEPMVQNLTSLGWLDRVINLLIYTNQDKIEFGICDAHQK